MLDLRNHSSFGQAIWGFLAACMMWQCAQPRSLPFEYISKVSSIIIMIVVELL